MRSILIAVCGISLLFSCQEKQSNLVCKLDIEKNNLDTVNIQVNLKKYIGKTVGELLETDLVKHYKDYNWSDEPPGKLNSLNLNYQNEVNLQIYAQQLKFTPSFSEINKFNIELFKKEKITKIIIEKNDIETVIK